MTTKVKIKMRAIITIGFGLGDIEILQNLKANGRTIEYVVSYLSQFLLYGTARR